MQQQHPIATWNQELDYWETGEVDIFGHSVAYSETLPKSGMTRRGRLFELPTSVPLTIVPGCSSSPGPVKAFPTPKAHDGIMGRPRTSGRPIEKSTHLGTIVTLLPTPVAQPSGNTPEDHLRKKPGRQVVTDLAILVENDLMGTGGKVLPTPTASEWKREDNPSQARRNSPGLTTVSVHFPTPSARDGSSGGGQHPDKRRAGGHTVNLTDAVMECAGDRTLPLFGVGSD